MDVDEKSGQECNAVSDTIITKTRNSLQAIAEGATKCSTLVSVLKERINAKEISNNKGLDFLELKNDLLLKYILGLTGVIMTKSRGQTIQGSPFVDQLLETRVVLEKMRPMEQKMKYQIDKLIRNAVDGNMGSDPLSFRANPGSLSAKNDGDTTEESDSEDEKPESQAKTDIYRPPRVAPQYFDGDEEEPAKTAEKIKKRSINKFVIRELQEEFLETPTEVHNMGDAYSKQLSRETKDKQRFEETYMTRLPVTKKEKHREKAASTIGVLGEELTDFSGRRSSSIGNSKRKKPKSFKKGGRSKKRFKK